MLISDLEHIESLTEMSNLFGGENDDIVSLCLSKGVLSLKLNDRDLFSSSYAGTPSSLIISLEGVSHLKSSYRVENINGVAKCWWTLSSGTFSSNDFFSKGS